VDIFFKDAPAGDRVFFNLVEMKNGYPTQDILSRIEVDCSTITASEDSSVPTNIKFDFPVHVDSGKEYSIVVGGYSIKPTVWVSKIGSNDVLTGELIETQPSLGSLFKSQNSSTWTASQYEDMKLNVYRARFKHSDATISVNNKAYRDEKILFNPIETRNGDNEVVIHYENHGMGSGDSVKPKLFEDTLFAFTPDDSTNPSIGQVLVTETGSGIVSRVFSDGFRLENMIGHFEAGQKYETIEEERDMNSYYSTKLLNMDIPPLNISRKTGAIQTTLNPLLNGVPFDELNKIMTVKEAINPNCFKVNINAQANLTGYTGGSVKIEGNRRYELCSITGDYKAYGYNESWLFNGIGHAFDEEHSSDNYSEFNDISYAFGEILEFDQPMKLIGEMNESRVKTKSVNLVGYFTGSSNALVSPIFSVDTFKFSGVANNIDSFTEDNFDTETYYPETDPINGIALYKYVTRAVALANPALDLKIYLDVHKPDKADFDIYIKKLEPHDDTDIDEVEWVQVNADRATWKNLICRKGEFREILIEPGVLMPELCTSEFSSFKLKIVGRSPNTAKPPLFKLLRIIAVT
jgi:hypothetical protein